MTYTVLAIYNAAISAAHGKGGVRSLSSSSPELDQCNIWYPFVLDQVQEAAFWPGCKRVNSLTLLSENTTGEWETAGPEKNFTHLYALPGDILRPRYLLDFSPFSLSFDYSRQVQALSCNVADAVLVYSMRQENPAFWTAGQRMATIHALAAAIVPAVSGDPRLVQQNNELANFFIQEGRADAANMDQTLFEIMPPELIARGGYSPELSATTSYVYPHGKLLA